MLPEASAHLPTPPAVPGGLFLPALLPLLLLLLFLLFLPSQALLCLCQALSRASGLPSDMPWPRQPLLCPPRSQLAKAGPGASSQPHSGELRKRFQLQFKHRIPGEHPESTEQPTFNFLLHLHILGGWNSLLLWPPPPALKEDGRWGVQNDFPLLLKREPKQSLEKTRAQLRKWVEDGDQPLQPNSEHTLPRPPHPEARCPHPTTAPATPTSLGPRQWAEPSSHGVSVTPRNKQ